MKTKIAVIIASLGRREVLCEVNRRLWLQSRPADSQWLILTKPEDGPAPEDAGLSEVDISPIGTCAQRNAGLDRVGNTADIIVFFDDDFVPAPDYLENLEAFFAAHPDVAGVTGLVLRDGVTGTGLSFDEADAAITGHCSPSLSDASRTPVTNLYGCNMAFRREAIMDVRFDENLPLYGWLEDVDFSVNVSQWGPMVRTNAVAGVHLGVKGGRTSGVRLGYSQIVNPVYLHRKGVMKLSHAATLMGRNLIANHLKALAPEPHIDRRGRVKGNWLAIRDIVSGKIDPRTILSM